jgi:hypothetical protein
MSYSNIVPNVSDIRDQDMRLRILRGFNNAHRVDRRFPEGVEMVRGEWVTVNADNTVQKMGANPAAGAVVVFRGTEGFDSRGTQQVTTFEHPNSLIIETDNYVADTYLRDDVMVAVLDAGVGKLRKAASPAEAAFGVAKVAEVKEGTLVLKLL